jgi:hypothetical protein
MLGKPCAISVIIQDVIKIIIQDVIKIITNGVVKIINYDVFPQSDVQVN